MTAAPGPMVARLASRMTAHPWQTLGTAFLLGAWLGLEPPHVPRSRLARAAFAMVGSIALRVAREVMLGEVAAHALQGYRRGTVDAPGN